MLYGRQEIRVPKRAMRRDSAKWVCDKGVVCDANFRFVSSSQSPQSVLSRVADCLGVIWSSLTGN